MSAKIAEQLAVVADLHTQLGEAYTELSSLYDVASAKSGKAGDDGASGKVSGRGGKTAVAPKGKGRTAEGDDDDLPDPKPAASGKKGAKAKKVTEGDVRAMAKKVIEKHGKEKVTEILGGKLAEVDEDEYAEKLAELEAALEEDGDDDDV